MLARNDTKERFLDSALGLARNDTKGVRNDVLLYWFKIGVGFVGVEDFVAVHYCDEIFCVREVYYIVGVAWKHVNCFDLVTRNLKVKDFVRTHSTLLDKAVAAHNDEELPLCIVPVLTFGNTWFADVD